MGTLNILGAQRVKALIEMLNVKKNAELNAIGNKWYEHEVQAKTETGFYETEKAWKEVCEAWRKRYNELNLESNKQRDAICVSYKEKEQQLWLCETLEEAKQIVGL